MTDGQTTTLMKQVRKLVAAQAYRELSDAQLLDRFRGQHDEAAFAALMERHGAMVLGVCRRVLGNHHDAEDACQATFLVLARKSSSIRKKDALASWLHGAAFRIAADLKKRLARRGSPETKRRPSSALDTDIDVSWREVQCILDEELARLPDNYRLPVVLCCLEGKARDEAAQQVGWSTASFRGRLDRGREMLRARLTRRGVTLSVAMLGTILAGNGTAASLPPTLALATCEAAAGFISGKSVATGAISTTVASLTQRMVQTMFLTKLKVAAVMLMILVLGGGGAGMILAGRTSSAQASQPAAAEKPTAAPQKPNQEKEAFTAWGKEVGGLQAGLGYHPGRKRAYHHGEKVRLVLRIRNVSKNNVPFDYHTAFLRETPPAVTDAKGNATPLAWPTIPGGLQGFGQADLAPGKEIEFYEFELELKPASEQAGKTLRTLYGTGTFHIQHKQVDATAPRRGVFFHNPLLSKLATGKLELEVKAGPPPQVQRAPAANEVSDFDRLQGKWIPTSCEMNGTKFTAEQLKNFPFNPSFDGNRYLIEFGKIPNEGTFELNPTANPKMITLHDKDGSKNLGIYVFEGDQLLLCIGESKKPRPAAFTTKVESGHSLIRFQRVPREDEVREVVDKFFKAALAGDAEKTRALAAPAISDQQLARFKGLARKLAVAKVHVTPGPAPTSHGANQGRALVVSEEVEVIEGRGKTKGHLVLTLLKDDERLKTKGWLIWDIDLRDQGGVDEELQAFIDRNMKLQAEAQAELAKATAWGKEVGGLQAGLGYHPNQKRAYRHGETVRLALRVRNVSQDKVRFSYLTAFLRETPPAVTDAKGNAMPLAWTTIAGGPQGVQQLDLAPGKEIELYELKLELKPASEQGNKMLRTLYGTGTFHIHYKQVDATPSGAGVSYLDGRLSKLATGKLELEVTDKPVPSRDNR